MGTSLFELIFLVLWVLIDKECLFDFRHFVFQAFREVGFFDEELIVGNVMQFLAHCLTYSFDHSIDFIIKCFAFCVGDHCQVRVSSPCLQCFAIKLSGKLETL